MKFRIHYTVKGVEDHFYVEGETVEEIREIAQEGVDRRGGMDPWSEEIR